jgi:O-antigen ligase
MAIASGIHLKRLSTIADWTAVAVAVSLPWSTSATGILLVPWLIALIFTLEWSDLRRQLTTAVGGLPVLLFLLGALGMLWADVSWHARLGGVDGFVRLLTVPLLMAQFRRSDGGRRVLIGFLGACVALLVASVIVKIWPSLHPTVDPGVPVKSYIVQSLEFVMCAVVLLDLSLAKARAQQWTMAAAFGALALAFLGDIFFVTTGRTALVVLPALIVVYGFRQAGWKGIAGAGVAVAILAAIVWTTSPYVRQRVTGIYTESENYEQTKDATSSGLRLAFWQKSIEIIKRAPLIGHGTGTIVDQFRRATAGQSGADAIGSANPHNQTFAVGIQLGLLGIVVLWAMWIAHLLHFRGSGLVAWSGLVVVTANIVGSLFNSFVFDFTEGWIYVLGVGVIAGMLQRRDAGRANAAASPDL